MNPLLSASNCTSQRFWYSPAALITLLIWFSGCAAEQESLHELDHEVPAHWPSSMEDAAAKIEQRLQSLSGPTDTVTQSLREELVDVIEWAPEIAADTDLPEADWIPIYDLSETLRKHLRATDITVNDCREDLERLVLLLRESQAKLPEDDLPEQIEAASLP